MNDRISVAVVGEAIKIPCLPEGEVHRIALTLVENLSNPIAVGMCSQCGLTLEVRVNDSGS